MHFKRKGLPVDRVFPIEIFLSRDQMAGAERKKVMAQREIIEKIWPQQCTLGVFTPMSPTTLQPTIAVNNPPK